MPEEAFSYDSTMDAARALGNEDYHKHIGQVCNHYQNRKSAYGFGWCYVEEYKD